AAVIMRDAIAPSAAANTAGTTDPVTIEPPETGPSGSEVSPSSTSTLSSGTPVRWDASCARIVYVPVPMSCVALAIRQVPSSRNCRLAAAPNRAATHEHAVALHGTHAGSTFGPTEPLRAKLEALN